MGTKTGRLALRSLVAVVALLALAGCSKHYWERPGGVVADFERESATCIEDAKASPYGPDSLDRVYRACMQGKGWKRVEVPVAQTHQFRGPEDTEDFLRPPSPMSGTRYMQDQKR